MVQRRLPDRCPHGDAARPYPVRPMPGWPLGENRDLDEALAQLESALTDCKVALTNSILELSSKDVSNALRSVPFGQRQAVLKPLGLMLKPRQITQSLCQDLRHRIRRVDEHAAWHAAWALTASTWIDLEPSAFADEHDDTSSLRRPFDRWGGPLCRLAVWSHGLAWVRDARIWLWAARQPWLLPDGVSDEQSEAIVESSGQVLKASPRFTHHTLMGDTDGELDESATDESTRGEFGALDADRGDLAMGEQAASRRERARPR